MDNKLDNLKIKVKNVINERADKKDIIREINTMFSKKGFSLDKLVNSLNGNTYFEDFNTQETLCIAKTVYDITKLSEIDYTQFFSQEDIEEYNTIEDLSSYQKEYFDEYEINKYTMLNEKYENERTRITYFNIYEKNLHYAEVNKQKDIMYFSTEELTTLIKGCIYAYGTTKQNMITFLNNYCDWCIENGWIKENNAKDLDVQDLVTNSKKFLEEKIFGKTEFYQMLKVMENETKLPNVIPLLLARYGIVGNRLKQMINLKWEHIDHENMVVRIPNDDGEVFELPIDEKFIKYINKAKSYSMSTKKDGNNIIQYSDNGYVLKKAFSKNDMSEPTIKYNTVFNRVNEACTSIGIPRIPFKSLLMTRQIELLLETRKNGRLTQKDFDKMIQKFDFDKSSYINRAFHLKKRYEAVTKDLVVSQRKNTRSLSDDNSYEIATKLQQELDLYV